MKVTRRGFLESTGATAGLAILGCRKTERPIAGGFVNESETLCHRLRDHDRFALPARSERRRVVVVGGGIPGLSAAWRLRKTGFTEFTVLEMEAEPGGKSRSGRNATSQFPSAAPHVPVPNRHASV